MADQGAEQLPRRRFFQRILRPQGKGTTKEHEIAKNEPKIVVVSKDNLPNNFPNIVYYNSIDFRKKPESIPPNLIPIANTQKTLSEESLKGKFPQETDSKHFSQEPIWVEPVNRVVITENEENMEIGRIIGEQLRPFVMSLIGFKMLDKADKMSDLSRRKFIKLMSGIVAGLGLADLVAEQAFWGMMRTDKTKQDKLASVYSMKARVSSMRSNLIMHDVWKQYGSKYAGDDNFPDLNYLLAVSESTADALEVFAQDNPENLKKQLISNAEFRETLIKSAKKAGSVDALFSYEVTTAFSQQKTVIRFSDRDFIDALSRIIDPYIQSKPYPTMDAA